MCRFIIRLLYQKFGKTKWNWITPHTVKCVSYELEEIIVYDTLSELIISNIFVYVDIRM